MPVAIVAAHQLHAYVQPMRSLSRRLAMALLVLVMALQAEPGFAWWELGHETVAEVAFANVKPSTKTAIQALLRKQALLETPTCPARTIEQASVWADCVKKLGPRFSYMESWHYQDADVCKPFDLKASCSDGNCVSRQIERQVKLLKDHTVPVRERVQALALLVHFVGDLHQPLHDAEFAADAGGNRTHSDYGAVGGARLNLHKIWDGYLAERAITTPPSIVRAYPAEERARIVAGSIEDWSRESWEVARRSVYPTVLGEDYCAQQGEKMGGVLANAQIDALVPVVRDEVVKGGLRLARLLDEALAS